MLGILGPVLSNFTHTHGPPAQGQERRLAPRAFLVKFRLKFLIVVDAQGNAF